MENLKKFLRACSTILVYFIIIILTGAFLQGILNVTDENDSRLMWILLVSSIMGCVYVVYKNRQDLKSQLKDFRKNIKKYSQVALKNWLIGYGLMIVVNLIVIRLLGNISTNEQNAREMMDSYLFYSVIYTCFLAPLSEEILFRMNFRSVFKDDKAFLWVTSLMFGAMHVVSSSMTFSSLLYIFPYMILGYFFGKAYIETDNIYSGVLAHMTQNILSLLIVLFLG